MINLYDILKVANGQLFGEPVANLFTDFCLDASQVGENQLFVALRTARGDTHQYIEEAIKNGASGILCVEPPVCDTTGVSVLMVPETSEALLLWAQATLRKLKTKTIAVVGSIAKSATVKAIHGVIQKKAKVLARHTDEIGTLAIPLTLSRLTSEHEYVVLKLTPTIPGEMLQMVQTIDPDIVVMTNLACEYSSAFSNCNEYFEEYLTLLKSLSRDSQVIINYDDEQIQDIINHVPETLNCKTVGIDRFESDVLAFNVKVGIERIGFDLRFKGQRYIARWSPLLGKHHLYGLLAALQIADIVGIDVETALKTLTEINPLHGRMASFDGVGQSVLIDDSFAASYSSTDAALEWLNDVREDGQRTIFVFGDMDKSGMNSRNAHRAIGTSAAEVADIFITKGVQAALSARAAIDSGADSTRVRSTYSNRDVLAALKEIGITSNDIILVKGGIQARMEGVVEALLLDTEDKNDLVRQEFESYQEATVSLRPSWVEVDVDAIASNIQIIRSHLADDVTLMAVVKADAYGHGAVQVARTAIANGATYLGVASIAEAVELRDAGITAPILVMSYAPAETVRQAYQLDLTLTVFDLEQAERYEGEARSFSGKLKVHIKIDSGMGRLGILAEQAIHSFRHLGALSNLDIEGIYTHFSVADSDDEYTSDQVETFNQVVRPLHAVGIKVKYIHAANSPGTLATESNHFNTVRPGLILYGLSASENHPLYEGLQAALTWKTSVLQVKTLPAGHPVGYGRTYYTKNEEKIAILPVGYADGFRRSPSWQYVLIHGQKAPIIGRVSMEKCAVNVTHINNVLAGDEVVLLGQQGDEAITAEMVAEWLDTINYEVVTSILPRAPRR